MKSLLCTIFAVVTLSGCAMFGVNTAPPEPPVPEFVSDAFPWGFLETDLADELPGAEILDIACQPLTVGACEVRFDEPVWSGHTKVFYYRDWSAHIAVIAQNSYTLTPKSITSRFRAYLLRKNMLVPPAEHGLKGSSAVVTYTGNRDGKRVRGKLATFYISEERDQLVILYGEWPERTNAQMHANFSRIAMELGLPQDLD